MSAKPKVALLIGASRGIGATLVDAYHKPLSATQTTPPLAATPRPSNPSTIK